MPFVYRYYPTVREARERIRTGVTGPIRLIHGGYLQDWLLRPTDDNWRVDEQLGGASRAFADIGSHWCDLAEFVTGHRITRVSARTYTSVPERVTEDAVILQFETDRGAVGSAVISQISAGRKNMLALEIDGANEALAFNQEGPEELWVGRRENATLIKRDPGALSAPAARLATLPAGHPQGYNDCFDAFVADAYAAAVTGEVPDGLPELPRRPARRAHHRRGARLRAHRVLGRRARRGRPHGGVGRWLISTLLQMQGIRKWFVGVEVLHGVDLDLRAGEVHAIVGENGAGKSTLMKMLAGVHAPDEGTIRIDGEEQHFTHPAQAQAAGVGIVYQEFNLLPERNVAENVFVGREPVKRGIVDRRKMERETAALLEEVGESSFGPRTPVRWLSVAQQQVVEIIKARSLNARILVLDEPTAALADHEVELLFTLVRRLQELGVGILYISHRLREVFQLSDRITVIKDGGVVKTLNTAECDQRTLVNLMVGRELDGYFPPRGDNGGPRRCAPGGQGPHDAAAARRQPRGARGRDRRPRGPAGLGPHRDRARDLRRRPDQLRHDRDRRQAGALPPSAPGGQGRASASSPRTARPRGSRSRSRSRTT